MFKQLFTNWKRRRFARLFTMYAQNLFWEMSRSEVDTSEVIGDLYALTKPYNIDCFDDCLKNRNLAFLDGNDNFEKMKEYYKKYSEL